MGIVEDAREIPGLLKATFRPVKEAPFGEFRPLSEVHMSSVQPQIAVGFPSRLSSTNPLTVGIDLKTENGLAFDALHGLDRLANLTSFRLIFMGGFSDQPNTSINFGLITSCRAICSAQHSSP